VWAVYLLEAIVDCLVVLPGHQHLVLLVDQVSVASADQLLLQVFLGNDGNLIQPAVKIKIFLFVQSNNFMRMP
jgi:hypothetical protein